MGGHGFGGGSGLVGINSDYLSKPTVEGDNWMITQQVASYLIKKMAAVVKDPRAPSRDPADMLFKHYLERKDRPPTKDILKGDKIDDEAISEAFAWRAAHLSFQAYEARIVQKQKWNMLLIQLHKLSRAYSESILVTNFYQALQSLPLCEQTTAVMKDLYRLYALYTMDVEARSFAVCNAVSSSDLDKLPSLILNLMTEKIRPHAVKLVDSWAMPDYLLDSALGRYD
ncbi:hypothetical protein LTS18_014295, partial [Coniosporium uncinatum]